MSGGEKSRAPSGMEIGGKVEEKETAEDNREASNSLFARRYDTQPFSCEERIYRESQ